MTILALTDGSERSLRALPYAAALARTSGRTVTLLRVLDAHTDITGEFAPDVETAVARVSERWVGELEAILAGAGIEGSGTVVRRAHGEGIATTILRAAEVLDAAAIAIDTRGHGALRHALLGSVALDVVQDSRLPVLATGSNVGPQAPEHFRHVVVAHDGSSAANAILVGLRSLIEDATIAVTVVRVASGDDATPDNLAKAERDLDRLKEGMPAGVTFARVARAIPSGGDIDAALTAQAKESGADLIALSTHGHSAARHLVAGSTALGLLSHATVPVLLARAE